MPYGRRSPVSPPQPERCDSGSPHPILTPRFDWAPVKLTVPSRQRVSDDELADRAEELLASGFRLSLVAAHDDGDRLRVVYLFLAGRPDRRVELERVLPAGNPSLSSLAYLSFPAGRFEREMLGLYGIRPIGHPQPRRLVRHAHWPEASSDAG